MMRVLGTLWVFLLVIGPTFAQEATQDVVETAEPAVTTTAEAPTPAPDTTPSENAGATTEEPITSEDDDRFVVICPIDDQIDEGIAVVIKRAVEEAKTAEALLFVINTPGGRVDSAIEITTAIMSVECPTIAYVEGMGAISAGAIISYSCDFIYMAEGTNIGASTPIMPGVETTEAMDEKSNSFVRGKYRALGEANGHNPLLGEAMVDRNMEIRGYREEDGSYYIFEVEDDGSRGSSSSSSKKSEDFLDKILDAVSEDGGEGNDDVGEVLKKVLGAAAGVEDEEEVPERANRETDGPFGEIVDNADLISARGKLLTLTSNEATHVDLADGIAKSMDDALHEFSLGFVKRLTITPTWEEALFAFLTSPTIAGLLLMAGMGGIYVEVRTPGFGLPGIIGCTCFALFFGSHMVIGMTDWIDVVLIVAGFLLIIAEVFLLPGFGIAGILGFACLMGGAYLALVKAPIPEFTWEFQQLNDALYTLTITMVSFVGFVVLSGLALPYTPMGRSLILADVVETPAEYALQAEASIGLKGVALSMLRPAGKGRFGTSKYDVVTRGEFIDKGTTIEIIESSGNRYVVTELNKMDDAQA